MLTIECHDKHTNGNNPGDSTVGLSKLVYQVLEEDAKAFDGAIGEHLHQEKCHSHHPSPATVRDLRVHIGPQETTQSHALERKTAG